MINDNYEREVKLAEMLNDASIDRVLAIDTEWKVIAWNKASEMISGVKKHDIIGRHLMEIFPQLGIDTDIINAFGLGLQGKMTFLPAKPGLFNRDHYENHFIPLKDEEEHIIGVTNIIHDVAKRIRAEQQLQRLNAELKEKYRQLEKANAELATFTSITGNDLKEPLKKVYTSLELIMINDGNRLSDSSKAGLRRIQAALHRVKLLLDDILAVSNASSLSEEQTTVQLDQVARAAQASLSNKIRESGAQIDIQPLPSITGSEQMMQNLFHNLIDNAIKFQPPGNRPVLTISHSVTIPEKLTDQEYVCIQFTDNGIGIDAADTEKIFGMFERLHDRSQYPGSGIGLTICRKIVEAHGGLMEVDSTPGKGSTFRCYLPARPDK
jgi:Bacteriophytochrome (light-regulated signal transduction histidine kinase)